MKAGFNFRIKIYVVLALAIVAAVLVRVDTLRREDARETASFFSEWMKFGKPVTVGELRRKDLPVYTKFTIKSISGRWGKGFVTSDIKERLREGEEIYFEENGGTPCGKIAHIGRSLDIDTGMFPVEVELYDAPDKAGSILVVFSLTKVLKDVLVVPNDAVDIVGDGYYLWKIEDGKARRVKVEVASRGSYGSVITEGVQPGDLIVFSGQSQLKEGDPVNVIK